MHVVRLKELQTEMEGPDKTEVLFSQAAIGQPSSSTSKLMADDFLEETFTFNPDLDMKMMGDIGAGFVDSLGDASMDCFTDLSGIMIEPSFMEQPEHKEEEDSTSLTFLNLDAAMKSQQFSLKRPFTEVEDSSSDLAKLSASVGLTRSRTPSLDHDYTAKRARLSPTPMPASVESVEEHFLVPDVSPASSPCPDSSSNVSEDVKRKQRREKNNQASKRSREIRKQKFLNMEVEEKRLIKENVQLEHRVAELEKLAKNMKEILVTRLKIKT